jgi:hypothetical protein
MARETRREMMKEVVEEREKVDWSFPTRKKS